MQSDAVRDDPVGEGLAHRPEVEGGEMKLYEVRAEVVAYVMAEDAQDAFNEGCLALSYEVDGNRLEASEVTEVTCRNWPLDGDWERTALVYNTTPELTLSEALDALPVKGAKP